MNSPFTLLNSKNVYDGKVVKLFADDIRLPSGQIITKEIVKHPGAVVILPQLSNKNLLLVRQYRHATEESLLEFPAGTLEVGEKPLVSAKREISEEVGHQAERWTELGYIYSAPGFCTERLYLFLAQELRVYQLPADEDEFIEVEEMGVDAVETAIASGEIVDAKSIAAFSKAKILNLL